MKRLIQGAKYDFTDSEIPENQLRFWPENPRIYDEVHSRYAEVDISKLNDDMLQEQIYKILKGKNPIRELSLQLTHEGPGLPEPLIVRKRLDENIYDVIEGNRRLAACRMARERAFNDPENSDNKKIITEFENLQCEVAPENLSDSAVFSLLSILHIHGKDPWSPFAKASYIRRRAKQLTEASDTAESIYNNEIIEKLRIESNETSQEIKTMMKNIDLMKEAGEEHKGNYSYYDVIHRNVKARKTLEKPEERQRWIEEIKDLPHDLTAQEFRKQIKEATSNDKYFTEFLRGKHNLKETAELSKLAGSTDEIYNRVQKFREFLETKQQLILSIEPENKQELYNKINFEFKKLNKVTDKIHKKLKGKRDD